MDYLNLADMFFRKRQDFPKRSAYRFKKDGQWKSLTFTEAVDQAEKFSAGLAYYGIQKGDKVALISTNRVEWALIDYAVLALGAALVPVYPTLLKDQIRYIVNDSKAKILIVENEEQREKVNQIKDDLSEVEHYFCIEGSIEKDEAKWHVLESLTEKGESFLKESPDYITNSIQKIKREDIATIIYTSGTTGEPKGAVLSHKNFLSNLDEVSKLFDCYPEDVFLSFLPRNFSWRWTPTRTPQTFLPLFFREKFQHFFRAVRRIQDTNDTLEREPNPDKTWFHIPSTPRSQTRRSLFCVQTLASSSLNRFPFIFREETADMPWPLRSVLRKDSTIKGNATENYSAQICSAQIRAAQICFAQICSAQIFNLPITYVHSTSTVLFG